jgi:hypothetical protein
VALQVVPTAQHLSDSKPLTVTMQQVVPAAEQAWAVALVPQQVSVALAQQFSPQSLPLSQQKPSWRSQTASALWQHTGSWPVTWQLTPLAQQRPCSVQVVPLGQHWNPPESLEQQEVPSEQQMSPSKVSQIVSFGPQQPL